MRCVHDVEWPSATPIPGALALTLRFWCVQVADFGLSKQKQQTYVSGVSSSRGTLPWIAPEIIKSPDAVTEKVWAPQCRLPWQ